MTTLTTLAAEATTRRSPRPTAGDGLLHPVIAIAIAVLIANDHALKAVWPGDATGKVSDFAGLLFFPVLLQAAWEVATLGRSGVASARVAATAAVATALVFASVKTLDPAAHAYSVILGWLQWAVTAAGSLVTGATLAEPHRVAIVQDPTDLIALPMVLIAWIVMRQRAIP
jgi:hypothetical protein